MSKYVLECQECGQVVAALKPEQVAKLAYRPENYIVLCQYCHREATEET